MFRILSCKNYVKLFYVLVINVKFLINCDNLYNKANISIKIICYKHLLQVI